jgi:hypothetical protein
MTPTAQRMGPPDSHAWKRISSFEKKPENGKIPAIASVAMSIVRCVFGSADLSPPIRSMSCSPESAWITLPAPRKRSALKNACVMRWKIPDAKAPTPMARNMYPSWLTVE